MTLGLDIEQHGLTLGLGWAEFPTQKNKYPKTIGNNMHRFRPQRPCCPVKIHRETIRRLNYYWRSHILAKAVRNGKFTLSSYLILQAKSSRRSQYR
ncbi:hypothetical protein DID88_008446 [Monilinia fructigena]|uniref:Uncharacterized protein n=1 Tax=Monilinia fructigena TaxID=38457 RepID=A0A395J5F5_9HELO|nr:hypothetical protein DID88_008446 [Monilinia fructigena]